MADRTATEPHLVRQMCGLCKGKGYLGDGRGVVNCDRCFGSGETAHLHCPVPTLGGTCGTRLVAVDPRERVSEERDPEDGTCLRAVHIEVRSCLNGHRFVQHIDTTYPKHSASETTVTWARLEDVAVKGVA